jgi:hypothetical protein
MALFSFNSAQKSLFLKFKMREDEYRNIQNITFVQANSGFGKTIAQKGQGKIEQGIGNGG